MRVRDGKGENYLRAYATATSSYVISLNIVASRMVNGKR
jgi:hypothetical protein